MTEEKKRRLVVASTVASVILTFILIAVLIFQLVSIFKLNNLESSLEKEKAHLEYLISNNKSEIEIRNSKWYIEKIARELGYSYNDEIRYK